MTSNAELYNAAELIVHATALLGAAGLDSEKAATVAEVLVEGDLLGHTTHGLALLPGYLGEIANGTMTRSGEFTVLNERPATAAWDGHKLPGPWLTRQACDEAARRAAVFGTGTVVIRRSHHIACLAAYLERITSSGLIVLIQSSDPAVAAVAPHGGTRPVFTPNPLAIGIPAGGDPILVDVSMSITTVGLARRLQKSGGRTPHRWLLDGHGDPTDDPSVLDGEPPGSLMLLGGIEAGHKGFGLALMIEALTSGLGGYGRADAPNGWGASVFVQVLDPAAFGGTSAFQREIDSLVAACLEGPSRDPSNPVRMPGHSALARKRRALAKGVVLHPVIKETLAPWSERLGVQWPSPVKRSEIM